MIFRGCLLFHNILLELSKYLAKFTQCWFKLRLTKQPPLSSYLNNDKSAACFTSMKHVHVWHGKNSHKRWWIPLHKRRVIQYNEKDLCKKEQEHDIEISTRKMQMYSTCKNTATKNYSVFLVSEDLNPHLLKIHVVIWIMIKQLKITVNSYKKLF
jgi:hypothetical protein